MVNDFPEITPIEIAYNPHGCYYLHVGQCYKDRTHVELMQAILTSIRPVFKYVYLMTFFTLLAGFFHPMIYQYSFDSTIFAIFVLFIGLAGGVVLVKSTESKHAEVLMGTGFVLIGISLYFIFLLTGRL